MQLHLYIHANNFKETSHDHHPARWRNDTQGREMDFGGATDRSIETSTSNDRSRRPSIQSVARGG